MILFNFNKPIPTGMGLLKLNKIILCFIKMILFFIILKITICKFIKNKGSMPEWLMGTDCKSVGNTYAGSNPARPNANYLIEFNVEHSNNICIFLMKSKLIKNKI